MNHTLTPWRLEFHPVQRGNPATLIMQSDAPTYAKWVAECHWGVDGTAAEDGDGVRDCTALEAQANAALIVRAVNCFDEAVGLCRRILTLAEKGRASRHEYADGKGTLAGCSISLAEIAMAGEIIEKAEAQS